MDGAPPPASPPAPESPSPAASSSPIHDDGGEGPGSDHRVHARIGVSTQIEVNGPDGVSPAELRDLSKGGARFFTPGNTALGKEGDTIELFLPSLASGDIAVMAQIIRVRDQDDGRLYGVRFDAVEPALQKGLSDLVELLLDTGMVQGEGPKSRRRVRRIDLRPTQKSELRGTLGDIATGTLLMTLGDALSLYEDIEVVLPDLAGGDLLVVPGRVAHQRRVERPGGAQFQIGIDFRALRTETRACLEALMGAIDSSYVESPEIPPEAVPVSEPAEPTVPNPVAAEPDKAAT